MNIGGGEAADQMVRMLLSGTEVVIRLSGSALKNLLALTLALARNHKKLSGKVNLGKMLRETRDLRQFSMTPEQYKEFHHRAKKQKLLFATVRDRDDRGKLIDVLLPVTELDRPTRSSSVCCTRSRTGSRNHICGRGRATQRTARSKGVRRVRSPTET